MPPVGKRRRHARVEETSMYRLMKSEKVTLDHVISGLMSSYRQTEVSHFPQFYAAYEACEEANHKGRSRHYIHNDSGQEYYDGTWID
jgi:hypothetical protein